MQTKLFLTALAFAAGIAGCAARQPDVVVRQGTQFTKSSTLTLVAEQDPAIFRPELEKELLRRGFHVISDEVTQVVVDEKTHGDGEVAAVAAKDDGVSKAAVVGKDAGLVRKSSSRIMKAEYEGKIEYLFNGERHTVSRVNFTILELERGTVVASIGFEDKGTNAEIARSIAQELDYALSGGRPKESRWGL